MKKTGIISLIIAAVLFASGFPTHKAYGAGKLKYSLILTATPLYKQSVEVFDVNQNIYFYLPPTYFVVVEAAADERDLVKCTYDGFTGFVRKADLGAVEYTPKYVYPEGLTLSISTEFSGLILRKSPENSSEILTTIPMSSTGIRYFNYIHGQNINNLGDKWYYVKLSESGSDIYGYVYGAYVTLDKPIANNIIEALPDPAEQISDGGSISNSKEIILIVLLCLPALLIIYILFKGQRQPKNIVTASRSKYIDE